MIKVGNRKDFRFGVTAWANPVPSGIHTFVDIELLRVPAHIEKVFLPASTAFGRMVFIRATLILDGDGQYRVSAIRAVEGDMRTGCVGIRQVAVMVKEQEFREIHIPCSSFRRRIQAGREGQFDAS